MATAEIAELPRKHEALDMEWSEILTILKLNPADPNVKTLVWACSQYGLDPLLRHAVLIPSKKGGANLYVTRDGLLHVAHRSGQLDGIEVLEQGETQTHYVAKVAVYRKDMTRPFTYIGRYPKQGSNKEYAPEMSVKCAEVMALRRAFDVAMAAYEERWDIETERVEHTTPSPVALPGTVELADDAVRERLRALCNTLSGEDKARLRNGLAETGVHPPAVLPADQLDQFTIILTEIVGNPAVQAALTGEQMPTTTTTTEAESDASNGDTAPETPEDTSALVDAIQRRIDALSEERSQRLLELLEKADVIGSTGSLDPRTAPVNRLGIWAVALDEVEAGD